MPSYPPLPPDLPPAEAPPPGGERPEGLWDDDLLRAALDPAAPLSIPVPAASPELLGQQAARMEGLLAGSLMADALTPGDLELLADLTVAQAELASGQARPPSPAVLEAARAALAPAEVVASSLAEVDSTNGHARGDAPAPERHELRVLRAPALPLVLRRPSLAVAAAALLAIGVGAWLFARGGASGGPDAGGATDVADGGLTPAELEALRERLAHSPALENARGPVAPFVEARLWRRVVGRADRGGEGLGLRQGPAANDVAAQPDVVLAWKPDQLSSEAGVLRVHVQGPAGLVVLLPDLGVEGVLRTTEGSDSAGATTASYVDLELPGGWAGSLPRRELRLAFRWPEARSASEPSASTTPASTTPAAPPVAHAPTTRARFDGVSLSVAPRGS